MKPGMAGAKRRFGGEAAWLAALLVAGVALRLWWLARTPAGLTGFAGGGEAARVALALARDRLFGDAFWDGSGPTAHLMPVSPAAAALVFRLLPPASAAASLILTGWALAQSLGGYLLLRTLFARLGADTRALRAATAVLLLLPIYAPEETVGFRYWEGALTVCLCAANLLLALGIEQRASMSLRRAVAAAALWAIAAFTSPIAGAALALVWAWVALRSLALIQALRFATLSALAALVLFGPWAVRNLDRMGSPVALRSNAGLEFAIGNHPAALSDRPPAQVYADRLQAIHPLYGGPGRAGVMRLGEVRYSHRLWVGTWRWAEAHPLGFARLCARHLFQFFAPPAWTLLLSTWNDFIPLRAALLALIDLAGLVAIAVGVRRQRPGYALLAIFVAAAALPYALVQPNPRYTYLVWGILAFAAADGLARYLAARPGAGKAR